LRRPRQRSRNHRRTRASLFEPVGDPSDKVWTNIQSKLREEAAHGANGESTKQEQEDQDQVKKSTDPSSIGYGLVVFALKFYLL